MSVLGWLLGFALPLCATAGAQGVVAPVAPASLRGLVPPGSPNHALAAPAGFSPAPDLVTPAYAVPAATLLATVDAVALAQPRVFALPSDARTPWRRDYVARSALLNFPDLVAVEVLPGDGAAGLVLWSRSVYGRSDLGVNRRRLAEWLAALDARLPDPRRGGEPPALPPNGDRSSP